MTKYIFVTGGVVSSLGKGVASGIIGALLQAAGYKIRLRKLDPYFNLDPGTMQPNEHGEVFVTEDGAETDLDLGHYERFTGINATKWDNITSGRIYADLLSKEREGYYLGKTVQVIPHVTDLIKKFIVSNLQDEDFVICEIGGTVGDMEAQPFLEAIRQLRNELGQPHTMFIHLTLVPYIKVANELKTKPTQHSVKELRSVGIQPDLLLTRSEQPISIQARQKIALYCNLAEDKVIQALDQNNVYKALICYHDDGLCKQIIKHFALSYKAPYPIDTWHDVVKKIEASKDTVTIAIVGKYMHIKDSYKSLVEALMHAGIYHQYNVVIKWIDAGDIEIENVAVQLAGCQGIVVPGGFGIRDTEGKIRVIQYARENKIPFLGICLGMQLALIEFARNVIGILDANSAEFSDQGTHIINLITAWHKEGSIEYRTKSDQLGGTMRLGSYSCTLKKDTMAYYIYQQTEIFERYRHRYGFNALFRQPFEEAGMVFSGYTIDDDRIEMAELPDHPYFMGVQFHPELKSRVFDPHKLFLALIKVAGS